MNALRTILIVEDDQATRENLRELLESEGYDVATAENGEVALRYLRNARPAPRLIMLDLRMPVMDGEAFLKTRTADERIRDIPVIAMTVNAHVPDEIRIRVEGLVHRPFDVESLLSLLDTFFS